MSEPQHFFEKDQHVLITATDGSFQAWYVKLSGLGFHVVKNEDGVEFALDKLDKIELIKPWCTCGVKTPQGQFHKLGCPARKRGWR